ncbi:hypothetical protein A2X44_02200 [candidate division CPR3 bacterium GWF2_35_18]|uniref:TfoX C-terminal domain-containing protein n=1 Tax=candidate division CPR3 bacterium GW2011_GWF2_35_18 TaxID=1618350 RepID=A0A0G0BKN2_UNCC3|nr:MAG: hypothetical protein UR67_C0002G0123 [candidate division CPR3 bacterium GW2011_GWF2_35_18]KKP86275.1 MAG: hypothetical protein UR87_C0024G0019 [candidate division CPR3 bacterium GW2011_GWE2_35_7]OGB62810.1 MAG: hypothetical protein A2X44_02200 [candidate division CPR3 bacterium GWF2_35_18]OGB65391.1 MAG: hypothetical protein A2250_00415 [candidate division CPR3 bacterium RIFOXYA2_FULL_35_13]OGB80278.1 MAG: hypothetical protein A2011_00195 [candidate division CPR3 bacterium GWE2_35_7]
MTKDSLESLPNLGKVTIKKLEQIGIKTATDFIARDLYEIFEELLIKVDPTLCRSALAGIVGAKKGIPWHRAIKESTAEYEKRHPKFKWKEY